MSSRTSASASAAKPRRPMAAMNAALLSSEFAWRAVHAASEAERKGITLASYWSTYVDLKVVFSLTCPEARGSSLKQMLDHLSLPQQGRAHSGIDE